MRQARANLHAKSSSAVVLARRFNRPNSWPVSQLSTRHRGLCATVSTDVVRAAPAAHSAGRAKRVSRLAARVFCIGVFSLLWLTGCRAAPRPDSSAAGAHIVARGGELIASFRTEPASFNRLTGRDTSTNLVSLLTHARLVRINQSTQQLEPQLAESWTTSDDGRRVTMALRRDVQFSDGHPFTSSDVLFTFEACYDPRNGCILSDSLQAAGRNLHVEAPDDHTVVIDFPVPFGPGVRILDVLPILPRHKLEAAQRAGEFGKAWGLTTPLDDLVGLGPFVLSVYQPGQRLVFTRNPRYYGKTTDGTRLPYLDRIVVEVVSDQSAELLRLESGQIDMMTSEIAPDAYAPLKRAAEQGRVKLLDLGVSRNADAFWMNLQPGAFAGDPRAPWIQRDELRQAISLAVDRKALADTVFLGAAVPIYGVETPANKVWYWSGTPEAPHDLTAARQLLVSIGLTDRDGDGMLEDAAGRPARFTLMTQKGRLSLERGAAVIRDDLKKIGLAVDVAALDASLVIDAFITRRRFDAIYFNATKSDTDPGTSPDFWFSSGTAHVWDLQQKTPATTWEKELDDLMARQIASIDMAERKRVYDRMQQIFIEHQPIVFFVAPRIYVAHSARVLNLTPAESRPQLLWRPETVAVVH